MASTVYFAKAGGKAGHGPVDKIGMLFNKASFSDAVSENDLVAIKLHFGERGGSSFVRPVFVRAVSSKIIESGGKPFLTDTGCLYFSARANARDHLVIAAEHGFGLETTLAPVLIADGLRGSDVKPVSVGLRHFEEVDVAAGIFDARSLFVVTHVTGHALTGFAGAIKNLGMGAGGRRMKLAIHDIVTPIVDKDRCKECRKCIENCPAAAISLDETLGFDYEKCIGCGECIAICPERAIRVEWGGNPGEAQEKLAEVTFAVVANKRERTCYFNFLLDVTPTCDCWNYSSAPLVTDIGVLASRDPVAIDQAAFDLVNHAAAESGRAPVFNEKDSIQMAYGEELGLGSREYELVTVGG